MDEFDRICAARFSDRAAARKRRIWARSLPTCAQPAPLATLHFVAVAGIGSLFLVQRQSVPGDPAVTGAVASSTRLP